MHVTAISTPLERVPLYMLPSEKHPIILLKSSQAATSSDRFSFGTPERNVMSTEPWKKLKWKLDCTYFPMSSSGKPHLDFRGQIK